MVGGNAFVVIAHFGEPLIEVIGPSAAGGKTRRAIFLHDGDGVGETFVEIASFERGSDNSKTFFVRGKLAGFGDAAGRNAVAKTIIISAANIAFAKSGFFAGDGGKEAEV